MGKYEVNMHIYTILWKIYQNLGEHTIDRITGRKARGLQME